MARSFGFVSETVARASGTGWTDEVAEEVSEAWEFLNTKDEQGNPRMGGKLWTDFETVAELGKWLRQAKAYAASRGLVLRRSGVREAAETRLYFTIESEADREVRLKLKAEREAKLNALKAAGQAPKRGRKPAAQKAAASK